MPRGKRISPEQVVINLRPIEVELAKGDSIDLMLDRDPFGGKAASSGDVTSRTYGFAGGVAEEDGWLPQFGARYYADAIGRFLSPEAYFLESPEKCVASPVECNLYSYAKNNPLQYRDPSGEFAWIPAILGAVAFDMAIGSGKANAPAADGRIDISMAPENILGLGIVGAQATRAAVKYGPQIVKRVVNSHKGFIQSWRATGSQTGAFGNLSRTHLQAGNPTGNRLKANFTAKGDHRVFR